MQCAIDHAHGDRSHGGVAAKDEPRHRPRRRRGAFAAALVPLCVLAGACTNAPQRPPSVLLIVVDTLRADHLGVYGHSADTSPRLDAFAHGAVVYENASTPAPFTMPAMAAMLTGLYPDRTGIVTHSPAMTLDTAPTATLAQLAATAGLRTGAVIANPWLANRTTGFRRGFQRYVDAGANGNAGRGFPAAQVADRGLELLKEFENDPFFVWLHFIDPHMPYEPPVSAAALLGNATATSRVIEDFLAHPERKQDIYFRGAYTEGELDATRKLYEAEIRYVDAQIGRVLDGLHAAGRTGDTIVIIASDHGESLGDHGLYFAHDFSLYDELVHAVLIVRIPGTRPSRIVEEVSLVDLVPTACGWLRIPCPPSLDGLPLPLVAGDRASKRTVFAASVPYRRRYDLAPRLRVKGLDGRWTMARRNGLKIIDIPHPDGTIREAYDLDADPGELDNLIVPPGASAASHRVASKSPREQSARRRGELEDLARSLTQWQSTMRAARPEPAPATKPLDERTLRSLRELGYLN